MIFLLWCIFLLSNPGFEECEETPDEWKWSEGVVVECEDEKVYEGERSVKIKVKGRGDFCSKTIKVVPELDYKFSIKVWENEDSLKVRLVIWWVGGKAYYGKYSKNKTEWQVLEGRRIAPGKVESVYVGVRAYGDGVFYLDDAKWEVGEGGVREVNHKPTNPKQGEEVKVKVKIIDEGSITGDTLFYEKEGESGEWVLHDSVRGNLYYYTIPPNSEGIMKYFIKAYDREGDVAVSCTMKYLIGEIGVRINEIYYDSPGKDEGCFIEIKGRPGEDLALYSIYGINGSNGKKYNEIKLEGSRIPQDGYLVIAQDETVSEGDIITFKADMQNGPDNVVLSYQGIIIDKVGYGDFTGKYFRGEGEPALDVDPGYSLSRIPDGKDEDNNKVDFIQSSPTPGRSNTIGVEEAKVSNFVRFYPKNYSFPRSSLLYDKTGRRCVSSTLPRGIYFLKTPSSIHKIIIIK